MLFMFFFAFFSPVGADDPVLIPTIRLQPYSQDFGQSPQGYPQQQQYPQDDLISQSPANLPLIPDNSFNGQDSQGNPLQQYPQNGQYQNGQGYPQQQQGFGIPQQQQYPQNGQFNWNGNLPMIPQNQDQGQGQECQPGAETQRKSFVYVCNNGAFEPTFCLFNGRRLRIEESFDDGNFVWKCSQPSLGRIMIKVDACSNKGQRYAAGQTWVENGRAAMVCSKKGDAFLEKEIIGCVGDNGVQVGHLGVVIMHGVQYRSVN